MNSAPTVRCALVIAALAAISKGFALAAGTYDLTAFTAADLDLSGDLSKPEFNTTIAPGLSPKAQAKKFKQADLNRDAAIQPNEFLIYRRIIRPEKIPEWWFYRADVSIDGALDFDEFKSGYKSKVSLVTIRREFLQCDVDHSATVILKEYSNFRNGLTVPHNITVFDLADFDNNGQLTPIEFGYAYSQTTSAITIHKRFVLLDDNADGVLTTTEWNPGVLR